MWLMVGWTTCLGLRCCPSKVPARACIVVLRVCPWRSVADLIFNLYSSAFEIIAHAIAGQEQAAGYQMSAWTKNEVEHREQVR